MIKVKQNKQRTHIRKYCFKVLARAATESALQFLHLSGTSLTLQNSLLFCIELRVFRFNVRIFPPSFPLVFFFLSKFCCFNSHLISFHLLLLLIYLSSQHSCADATSQPCRLTEKSSPMGLKLKARKGPRLKSR